MKFENSETKKSIQREFMNIYEKKDYRKISIKEICSKIPVARTTFYSYYGNIDELKNEIEDTLISGILKIEKEVPKNEEGIIDFYLFFEKTINYIKNNKEYIYIFLIVQPNFRFVNKWKEAIKNHALSRGYVKRNISNYDLILEVIASSAIGAYTFSLTNPKKVDIEKLNEVVVSAIKEINKIV